MDAASLLLLVLLIAVFYFLLIRPQQRQRRQVAHMQATLAPGARVMTGAGLLGTIVSMNDDEVVLEVAPGVNNTYVRRAIVNVLPSEQPPAGIDEDTTVEDTSVEDTTQDPKEDRTNGDDTTR